MLKKSTTSKKNKDVGILAKRHLEELERKRAEEAEFVRQENEKIAAEERLEQERQQKIKEGKEEKARKKEEKIRKQKENGTYRTASQKKKEREIAEYRNRNFVTKSSSIEEKKEEIYEDEPEERLLRSPIICIMGHVDTGKTKILDKLRNSNIQEHEAAGITQQIGASFKPRSQLPGNPEIPGLLFIDTPGHSAFGNLRTRGSKICDIVILVVDIMKGIERQTLESIEICERENLPFIIALNKIDRIYSWENERTNSQQFQSLKTAIFEKFWQKEKNPRLFYEQELSDEIICVPVSAITGEGLDDLLTTCITFCEENLDLSLYDELDATIMESKKNDRGEYTIDVILKTGTLNVGDTIGLSTISGRRTTRIRGIHVPDVGEESRMTNNYLHLKTVTGSCGVMIIANDLEGTIPGIPLFKLENEDEEFEIFESSISVEDGGIAVFAPSLGQLEALLVHLRDECRIKVSIAEVGDVYKRKILYMSRFEEKLKVILCFDVELNEEARMFIADEKINVISDQTIYRLSTKYLDSIKEREIQEAIQLRTNAKIPFKLRISNSLRNKNPVILEVIVEEGELNVGMEICDQTGRKLGFLSEIRMNDSPIQTSVKGSNVSICLITELTFGRQISKSTELYPIITRESLDILKTHFKSLIDKNMFELIKKMKLAQSI